MSDRRKSSPLPATAGVPSAPATPTGQRTTSWSNIVALEGDAAAVVAGNRPLPDVARGLVDVAQKAKKAPRSS